MRILFVADINSPLLLNLTERLSENLNREIYIYDFFKGRIIRANQLAVNFKPKSRNKNLKTKLITFGRILRGVMILGMMKRFEHTQIQYVHPYYGYLSWLINRKTKKLVTCLYGSDFYQLSALKYTLQNRLYKYAQFISFTNERMLKDFRELFPYYQRKLVVCRFGLSLIDSMDSLINQNIDVSQLISHPKEKTVIVIGHSSSIREQHLKIIDYLLFLSQEIKNKVYLVFPMTYNADQYLVTKINIALEASGFEYKLLTSFLTDAQLAALRLRSDIMINLPSSDQMNAAMLETLYAGGVVITGSWLPYELLDSKGIDYIKINNFNELPAALEQSVRNLLLGKSVINKQKNKGIISDLFKWDQCIHGWLNLLSV